VVAAATPSPTTLRGVRLLDLAGDGRPGQPIDITVRAGRIASIVPTGAEPVPEGICIEGKGRLALPGLVDAHVHSSGAFNRGLVDNLPLELFMLYEVPPFDFGPLTPELYRGRVLFNAVQMLKAGTTAAMDDPIYAPVATPEAIDAVMGAYRDIGMRATVAIYQPNKVEHSWFPYLADLLPADVLRRMNEQPAPATDEIVELYEDFVSRWQGAEGGRLRCAASCSAPQRATDDYMLRLHALASTHAMPFNLHVYESKVQRVAGAMLYGESLIRHVRRLGILDELSAVIHAVWVDDDDVSDLAQSGATVIHSPSGNLRCGSGIMPFRKLRSAGVPVALCTDEATVEETCSLWNVGRLAALVHKVSDPDYEAWPTANEILVAMTEHGARALRAEGEIGTLREGACADLILLDMDGFAYTPLVDLRRQLVYGEDGRSISLVMVGGRVVVEDGRVLTVDEDAVLEEVRELIPAWLDSLRPAREWGERLRPYFDEMYRRCAFADVGLNRWVGNEGVWLASRSDTRFSP
jgi:5-methylthioadenosine/S-adenosylhomocysteine deaminase